MFHFACKMNEDRLIENLRKTSSMLDIFMNR